MSYAGTVTTLSDGRADPWGISPAKAVALIVLFGLLAYANSISKAFVFDDTYWIVQHPLINAPLEYIRSWGNRWLIAATILVNHRLGGLNPVGYHVFNLGVHVAAALTLFDLVRRTLLLPRWGGRFHANASTLALIITLIWMLHPLQTQSVTYVVQRCESLMGLFYLLTTYCALRAFTAPAGGWRWGLGAIAACGLGMVSKEVMVTAPLMVVLFDWVFLALPWREQLRRRWPLYLGLASTCLLLTPALLGAFQTVDPDASVGFNVVGTTPLAYARTQPGVILYYLRLSVWPSSLCLDYWDWPAAESLRDWLPQTIVIGLLLIGSAIGVWRRNWLGFLGAWCFGILALTSSILPIADKAFEHRMYLPLLGPVAAGVVLVHGLLGRLRADTLHRALGITLSLAVIAALTAGTIRRNADYASVERMWRDVIAKRPANPRAYASLGAALLDAGRLDDATEAFRTALILKPNEPTTHNNLGVILVRQGKLDEALRHYRAAIESRPAYASPYHQLGLDQLRRGQTIDAIKNLRRAVDREPRRGSYRFVLAFALFELGDDVAANDERRRATLLDPAWPRRSAQRAWELTVQEQPTQAALQEALLAARIAAFSQETPDAETLYALALAWAANGATANATTAAKRAARRAREQGDAELESFLSRKFALLLAK